MPFALHLPQDVDTVVVPQCPGHFVVVHREVVLLFAPQFGQSSRVDDLEDAGVTALPRNVAAVALGRIVQQLLQEVPQ